MSTFSALPDASLGDGDRGLLCLALQSAPFVVGIISRTREFRRNFQLGM